MNLDDLKKLSEIFNNFAQPIATVIASWVGAKLAKSITQSNKKKRRSNSQRKNFFFLLHLNDITNL